MSPMFSGILETPSGESLHWFTGSSSNCETLPGRFQSFGIQEIGKPATYQQFSTSFLCLRQDFHQRGLAVPLFHMELYPSGATRSCGMALRHQPGLAEKSLTGSGKAAAASKLFSQKEKSQSLACLV